MIYFDNSATTRPCDAAVSAAQNAFSDIFANPSSRHAEGLRAARLLSESRKTVADVLKVSPDFVYFTSGGTLSDNIALLGCADMHRGNKIVTDQTEHPAVLRCMDELSRRGFEIVSIAPEKSGDLPIEKIKNALDKNTCLVSIMHVNNETGAVYPIDKIREAMNDICPDALLHTDAVQSFGKLRLYPEKWGIDLVSASAHKIHGIKGAGLLYIRRGIQIKPTVLGGGQEKNIVSGTENLPAVAAFAAACREIDFDFDFKAARLLYDELSKIKGIKINRPENFLPQIINLSFGRIPSEVILNALSGEGVCISAGSACSSSKAGKSHVLSAMNIDNAPFSVRLSLSKYNTEEEVLEFIKITKKTLFPLMEALS